jgi:hypothetical protein
VGVTTATILTHGSKNCSTWRSQTAACEFNLAILDSLRPRAMAKEKRGKDFIMYTLCYQESFPRRLMQLRSIDDVVHA